MILPANQEVSWENQIVPFSSTHQGANHLLILEEQIKTNENQGQHEEELENPLDKVDDNQDNHGKNQPGPGRIAYIGLDRSDTVTRQSQDGAWNVLAQGLF